MSQVHRTGYLRGLLLRCCLEGVDSKRSGDTQACPTISPESLTESAFSEYRDESDGISALRSLIFLLIHTTACEPALSNANPTTTRGC